VLTSFIVIGLFCVLNDFVHGLFLFLVQILHPASVLRTRMQQVSS
jgi:hypothetical protein